jgi:hypothetical protein
VVAARDSDNGAFRWWPPHDQLDRWLGLYHRVTRHNRAEADAGRFLLGWARQAGFESVTLTSTTWVFATPEERDWWSTLWSDRTSPPSTFGRQAIEYGYATRDDLIEMATGWRSWAALPDACFFVPHGEILAIA